jgi:hypothetical protein
MKLRIEINLDGAAFEGAASLSAEIERLLEAVSDTVWRADFAPPEYDLDVPLADSNGNTVGRCWIESGADGAARRHLSEVEAALHRLADYLAEAHGDEIQNDHHGDDPATCTYCAAIKHAADLLARGKGKE